jgi:hypothetical protein
MRLRTLRIGRGYFVAVWKNQAYQAVEGEKTLQIGDCGMNKKGTYQDIRISVGRTSDHQHIRILKKRGGNS